MFVLARPACDLCEGNFPSTVERCQAFPMVFFLFIAYIKKIRLIKYHISNLPELALFLLISRLIVKRTSTQFRGMKSYMYHL